VGGVGIDDDELELAAVGARTGSDDDKGTGGDDEGCKDETKARGPFGGALPVIVGSRRATSSLLAASTRACPTTTAYHHRSSCATSTYTLLSSCATSTYTLISISTLHPPWNRSLLSTSSASGIPTYPYGTQWRTYSVLQPHQENPRNNDCCKDTSQTLT
jgi:hypothetical protein